jgi:hypothetical protein
MAYNAGATRPRAVPPLAKRPETLAPVFDRQSPKA